MHVSLQQHERIKGVFTTHPAASWQLPV